MKLPAKINWKGNPHAIAMHHFWVGAVYAWRRPQDDSAKSLSRFELRLYGRHARENYARIQESAQ